MLVLKIKHCCHKKKLTKKPIKKLNAKFQHKAKKY